MPGANELAWWRFYCYYRYVSHANYMGQES